MTPFDSWFSSTVLPQLEQTLKAVPKPAHEPMRKAAREQMAACWNAALNATHASEFEGVVSVCDINRLKVE